MKVIRYLLVPTLLLLLFLFFLFGYYVTNVAYDGKAEKFTIQNSGVELSGILVTPKGDGPYPGILLLHGAGPQKYSKWYYKIHTNALVEKGFAVVSYDRRGSGGSSGDLRHSRFDDMVSDALAMSNYLRDSPDVVDDKIGFFAISQSGWYVHELAEKFGDVGFIVGRVSPPLPWMDIVLHEIEVEQRDAGVSEEGVEKYLELKKRIWEFYITVAEDGYDTHSEEMEILTAELAELNRIYGDSIPSSLLNFPEERLQALADRYSYDPRPFIERSDIPMYIILGGVDQNIPFDTSNSQWNKYRNNFGKDITVQVYPEEDHYMLKYDWFPLEGLYVNGYLEGIQNWVEQFN